MDIKTLLRLLKENNVCFVIIGGWACIVHGIKRLTEDIDIFIKPTAENVEKTFRALKECGYDLMDVTIEEALQKKLLFRQYILETDIHSSVKGVDFETVWNGKVLCKFEGDDYYFSSIDDLMKMKKAAGRPQDLEDLRHLEEIKKQLAEKSPNPSKGNCG